MRTLCVTILAAFAAFASHGITLPVCEVAERAQRESVVYPGRVVPVAQVDVVPQVSGEILEVCFANGAEVKEGDVLYRIDSVKYEAAVRNAESKVAECKAKASYAEHSYSRYRKLLGSKGVSLDEVDNSLALRDSSRAARARALCTESESVPVAECLPRRSSALPSSLRSMPSSSAFVRKQGSDAIKISACGREESPVPMSVTVLGFCGIIMRMNTKILSMLAAGLALVGCCTCDFGVDPKDPVVGNWGLKLGYPSMNAGHMIVSRDANGAAQALVLWRWASPTPMKNVVVDGNKITFDHPWGFKFEGTVDGNSLVATTVKKDGKPETTVKGWRNPVIKPASTKDAKLGEPIDLLADGLDGWKLMDEKAKNGWKFKDGVLSNELGLKPDGKWAGGGSNLMSKRADFYDFNLEYDVRVPKKSNSGVYLRGRYECQVLDSYGQPVNEHNMAAYYGRVVPKVAAEKPAGEWQHVSVTLYKRHLTVVLNGVTIIEDAPVVGITGGAIDANEFVPGPIYLQGDHSDADFKNMILRPAK